MTPNLWANAGEGQVLATASTNDVSKIQAKTGPLMVGMPKGKLTTEIPEGCYAVVRGMSSIVIRPIGGRTSIRDVVFLEAGTEEPVDGVDRLEGKTVLNMRKLPACMAIRADTRPPIVGSVKFTLEGLDEPVVVNHPPYVFRGRSQARLGEGWYPVNGQFRFKVTPYSLPDGRGSPGAERLMTLLIAGSSRQQ